MIKLNIGSGTHRAGDGWVNVDVVENDDTHPDLIANVLDGLPYGDGQVDRVFLGHVLEHVAWTRITDFAAEIFRVMCSGGQVMVNGPDVDRTLMGWHEGRLPKWLLLSVMEHASSLVDGGEGWEGARHSWNCTEERAVDIMEWAGFTIGPSYSGRLSDMLAEGWPLVANTDWQFGFVCTKP